MTRFYYSDIAIPVVLSSFNSNWNKTAGAVQSMLTRQRRNIPSTVITSPMIGQGSPAKQMTTVFATPPLTQQVINGTFIGEVRIRSSSTLPTANGILYLRLINTNGSVISDLGESQSSAIPHGTATENRQFPAITLTNVAVSSGQRLSVEFGWYMYAGANGSVTFAHTIQNNNSADAPYGDITAAGNYWFEFSQDLKLISKANMFF